MSEQRLVDIQEVARKAEYDIRYQLVVPYDALALVPTIDPETLPIVKELREKLELAKSERNAAIECLHKCCVRNGLCDGCTRSNGFECTDTEAKYFCEEGGSDMWEWSWNK